MMNRLSFEDAKSVSEYEDRTKERNDFLRSGWVSNLLLYLVFGAVINTFIIDINLIIWVSIWIIMVIYKFIKDYS